MKRTYKYRLYPNRVQDKALDFLLWQGRNLYNAALEQRVKTYQETGKGISYSEQWAHFRDERNANPETLGKLNATSVQQMLRRLDKSFSAFFRRLKAGEKPGFPRFKGRNRFHSLEYRHGSFLTQNRHLSLSAHDAGLGEFRQLLEYKAENAGSQVVTVSPRNTSQVCSGCGEIVPKKLKVRTHVCPACGLVEDRDVNAARNILVLAVLRLGRSRQALTRMQQGLRCLRSRRL
ncbi:MAG: hypothetical protein A3F84_11860 [Candidatus Handelsmanbacteria bacterium RIFCSPLOWO2_12_FULL_64_10]|uniref:Transposase n=1 Tax=Handelsmanbacteria sp. (strain RIFCSPLOWO2_12_FULL_64_10) TaxID=1817868 RepID=A0A1F6C7J6_HANXR|nr:MAG: hypothetical protein A3F84_11860 [Candidatus Handelsmanbacteria bacterium RIFCSPLOWO2_12_FULL_64_10]